MAVTSGMLFNLLGAADVHAGTAMSIRNNKRLIVEFIRHFATFDIDAVWP